MKPVQGRVMLLSVFVIFSVVFFLPSYPSVYNALPSGLKNLLPDRGIALGLDLQGGLHLVLEVDQAKAVDIAIDKSVTIFQDLVKEHDISVESVKRVGADQIVLTLQDATQREDLTKVLDEFATFYQDQNASSDTEVVYVFREEEAKRIKTSVVDQALETIRNRIDQFGVTEPLIARQGLKEIVVQLPGVKDPKRAIDLIQKTALLEFKMLDEDSPLRRELPTRIPASKVEEVMQDYRDRIPAGDEILFEKIRDEEAGLDYRTPYLIKKQVVLAGDVLRDARVAVGKFNRPYVAITFDSQGAAAFERITGANIGKRMAVILDHAVYSDPVIRDRIGGGRAQITGRFSFDEANDLALVLRAGSLPAPMKIIQNLTVGPSLGQDSIDKGLMSTSIAGCLVVLFMIVYYRVSGLIADVALALNLLCLIGALSGLNATLTLPGIAGIILTIGMGVDSNILIFERIREELRLGKPVRPAVDAGYDKALLTIVDAHVTTLITGLALFLFGTGPIKGFAVTLCLGLTINLFTALVGTKVVFDLMNRRGSVARLSI